MRFGLAVASQLRTVDVAVEDGQSGYDSVGFGDTPLACSTPSIVAGLVMSRTKRTQIELGRFARGDTAYRGAPRVGAMWRPK